MRPPLTSSFRNRVAYGDCNDYKPAVPRLRTASSPSTPPPFSLLQQLEGWFDAAGLADDNIVDAVVVAAAVAVVASYFVGAADAVDVVVVAVDVAAAAVVVDLVVELIQQINFLERCWCCCRWDSDYNSTASFRESLNSSNGRTAVESFDNIHSSLVRQQDSGWSADKSD